MCFHQFDLYVTTGSLEYKFPVKLIANVFLLIKLIVGLLVAGAYICSLWFQFIFLLHELYFFIRDLQQVTLEIDHQIIANIWNKGEGGSSSVEHLSIEFGYSAAILNIVLLAASLLTDKKCLFHQNVRLLVHLMFLPMYVCVLGVLIHTAKPSVLLMLSQRWKLEQFLLKLSI